LPAAHDQRHFPHLKLIGNQILLVTQRGMNEFSQIVQRLDRFGAFGHGVVVRVVLSGPSWWQARRIAQVFATHKVYRRSPAPPVEPLSAHRLSRTSNVIGPSAPKRILAIFLMNSCAPRAARPVTTSRSDQRWKIGR
jgi:hypothetical protein